MKHARNVAILVAIAIAVVALPGGGNVAALIGAIWQVQNNIAVDFGLRGAHVNDHTVGEIRAGVTFAFGVTKGPDILSRLIATALHGVHL